MAEAKAQAVLDAAAAGAVGIKAAEMGVDADFEPRDLQIDGRESPTDDRVGAGASVPAPPRRPPPPKPTEGDSDAAAAAGGKSTPRSARRLSLSRAIAGVKNARNSLTKAVRRHMSHDGSDQQVVHDRTGWQEKERAFDSQRKSASAFATSAASWLFNDSGAASSPASPSPASPVSAQQAAPQLQQPPPPPAVATLPATVKEPAQQLIGRVVSYERKQGRRVTNTGGQASPSPSPQRPAGLVTIFVLRVDFGAGGDSGEGGGAGSGQGWDLRKRYNDFKSLDSKLKQVLSEGAAGSNGGGGEGDAMPQLPAKERGEQTPERLEARRLVLDAYLQQLTQHTWSAAAQQVLNGFFECKKHEVPEDTICWKLRE